MPGNVVVALCITLTTELAEDTAVPSSSWAKASFIVKVWRDSFLLMASDSFMIS